MRTTPSDICAFAVPPPSAAAASKPRTSARKSRTGSLLALLTTRREQRLLLARSGRNRRACAIELKCQGFLPNKAFPLRKEPSGQARVNPRGGASELNAAFAAATALALRPPCLNGTCRDQLFGGVTWPRIS